MSRANVSAASASQIAKSGTKNSAVRSIRNGTPRVVLDRRDERRSREEDERCSVKRQIARPHPDRRGDRATRDDHRDEHDEHDAQEIRPPIERASR